MGCLSRIGCLVVVVGAGAVGYWLYGDRLPSELSRAAGKAVDKVSEATGGRSTGTPSSRRDSAINPERAITWATIEPSGPRNSSTKVAAALGARDGPAFVTLGAGDLAALLSSELPSQLPKSASNLQVALEGDQLLVRAAIDVTEIAGDGTLGRLLGTALSGRDSVQFAGTIEPLRPGFAQFRVDALRLKGINVPPRLIPTFIGAIRRGPRAAGLADNALALPLPRTVADLRIANGRLTLYKAVPNP
ncbi:MAG: hypothetical protein IPP90_11620 [Gemmatimonadaceae bacterium]|nr:hypothetical protein [Gemmatimonadaceae bacterium]